MTKHLVILFPLTPSCCSHTSFTEIDVHFTKEEEKHDVPNRWCAKYILEFSRIYSYTMLDIQLSAYEV